MALSSRGTDAAFDTLERRLLSRRFAALGVRMRALLLLLAAYVAAFTYWQVRVPLDGLRRARGAGAATLALAAALAALALAGAAVAAWRRAALTARPPGPEWLALPAPPDRVARHLDGEALWPAAAAFVPAMAGLAAGAGVVPVPVLLALACAFALLWWLASGAAARIARFAMAPAGKVPLPRDTRALLAASRPLSARPLAPPRWRREPAWRAVARLDGLASSRRSAARTRLVLATTCFLAGAAAWFTTAPPLARRALAYLGFGAGAAALGGWAVARACADPPQVMRPLPLAPGDAWRARAVALSLALAFAALANAALAASLPPLARVGLVIAWLPSGAAVAFLGLHYGLTLAPRATVAENLYYGWLAVAIIASWMVPLLGWAVMIAGLVHSGRQLARTSGRDVP